GCIVVRKRGTRAADGIWGGKGVLPAERHAACGRIVRVRCATDDDVQGRGRIRHRARVRPYSVLRVRNGNDACATGESDRRLDAPHAIAFTGTADAAARLRAERYRTEIGGHRRCGTGTGPTRIAIERVRVIGQSASPGPPAGGKEGAEVRPLGEVGLTEDDGATSAQLCGDR